MKNHVIMSDDGIYPKQAGRSFAVPDGAIELPDNIAVENYSAAMLVDGAWVERPQLPMPVSDQDGFSVAGVPSGARVVVTNIGTGQMTTVAVGPLEQFSSTLAVDGTFYIAVLGPRPWLESRITIVRGTGSPELAAAALTRIRNAARARIDTAIGKTRLKYVTDIPGQQTIYTEKQAEARAYLTAQPTPATLAEYPLLAAEVGVTAPTAWQLAQVWANKAVLFKFVAAITEKLRMEASIAIDAADTEAAIETAVTASLTTLSEGPLG